MKHSWFVEKLSVNGEMNRNKINIDTYEIKAWLKQFKKYVEEFIEEKLRNIHWDGFFEILKLLIYS